MYAPRRPGRRTTAVALIVAAGALIGSTATASAQELTVTEVKVYERIAFDAADTDGDGVVSEAELARDAARGFATLDKNGDRALTPDELAPHDATQFQRVDRDGDGKLSFKEVMLNKTRALKEGDKDQDGGLSFDEMVAIVEIETGGAP